MIELTELHYVDGRTDEQPLLLNPRHIVSARPARGDLYKRHGDKVYLIRVITGDTHFVVSGMIGDDPENWAQVLKEAA